MQIANASLVGEARVGNTPRPAGAPLESGIQFSPPKLPPREWWREAPGWVSTAASVVVFGPIARVRDLGGAAADFASPGPFLQRQAFDAYRRAQMAPRRHFSSHA
jgi:hypothetical protein